MKKKIVAYKPELSKTSTTYFLEKASDLLYNLLVHPGNAKSRLRDNELLIMFVLNLDVPIEYKSEQKKIFKLLSKKEAIEFEDKIIVSAFQNSISSIRNSTAAEIITRISSLVHGVKSSG